MKVCRTCGGEIYTFDGDNYCEDCLNDRDKKRREKAKAARKARNELMKSLGLTKVRGAMGGTYWE